ncbi:MAG: DUF5654 family protein [bacterium]|nr:DUF5654 family protein [bacterium]
MAAQSEKKLLHIELMRQMITLATSGFGLVAALAWNNVIQEFVKSYVTKWLPQGGSLISLFLYAVVVTGLAVIITYQLTRILDRLEHR